MVKYCDVVEICEHRVVSTPRQSRQCVWCGGFLRGKALTEARVRRARHEEQALAAEAAERSARLAASLHALGEMK